MFECIEVPGEAGHIVGDYMGESHLDLCCAGLSVAESSGLGWEVGSG